VVKPFTFHVHNFNVPIIPFHFPLAFFLVVFCYLCPAVIFTWVDYQPPVLGHIILILHHSLWHVWYLVIALLRSGDMEFASTNSMEQSP